MPAPLVVISRWLTLCCFLLSGYFCDAQLTADFSANSTSGCSPIVVKFTDLSAGNPTTWKWDLGNGTTSFLRNPSVTYFAPGQYNVKLIISNSAGKDSLTKTKYITVYAKPTVDFSTPLTAGCFPLGVKFTDASSPGSGSITKWEWDFGDGESSQEITAQHIYKAAGNFNVSLRITNSFGCSQSLTKPDYIKINTGVLAGFTIQMSNSCKASAPVNFTNTSTGSGPLTYQWDFGDGNGSSLTNPLHVYTTDGTFTVKLIVKNATGCTDTFTNPNAIVLGNINADFSAPSKICEGEFVKIANTSTPSASSVRWDFGDGTSSNAMIPSKKYLTPGNYVVKMVAKFGGCTDSTAKPLEVLTKPVANFSADNTSDCKVPFTVNFSQSIAGATGFKWDFGDGNFSNSPNPSHTYTSPGNYDVKLIAANALGCFDTLVKPEFIKIKLPEVSLLNLPVFGCAPFTFDFKSAVNSPDPVTAYQWNFGDSSSSSLATPSHTFLNPGRYTISVTITTAGGCTATTTMPDAVVVGEKPFALLSANPRNVCANAPVNFTDLSTGTVDQWQWFFGDGGTSSQQNPIHFYTDTGYFSVTLVASNNGCTDTVNFNNYIHVNPPIANFLMTFNCALPLQRVFTDKSIGADTWLWDFGDSTTSTTKSPVHNYALPGKYTVKLTVTNLLTGCFFAKTQNIIVIDEKANFIASDSIICKGKTIKFAPLNIDPNNISSYAWNFGDGNSATNSSGPAQHIYSSAGDFTVTLTITDLIGCTKKMTRPLYIHVDGPTALFNPSTPGSCLNTAITFTDKSTTDGTHNIVQWIWYYGDGIKDTLSAPPFQHTYASPGNYVLGLKVTDSKGCADSLIKSNGLIISKPVAAFSTADTLSCPIKPINFINKSTGPNLTYLWNFGDGLTSSQASPVHQYAAEGTYTIHLSIVDKYGCTDSVSKTSLVKIYYPVADFSMSDSVSTCPPLVVNFTSKCVNVIDGIWDFGDGNTSTAINPSHFFALPGKYTITLKVMGPGGCIDQKSKTVFIKGPNGTFSYTNLAGCTPLQTSFSAITKNTTSIVWDFNDGNTVTTTDSVITHDYTIPGVYLPRIILVDSGGCQLPILGKDTIVVYGVQANFNNTPSLICDSGRVNFTSTSTSNDLISSYAWDFGDGITSSLQNPVHSYQSTGFYSIKFKVTTRSGCIDTLSVPGWIKVVNSPKAAIAGNLSSCIPAVVDFAGVLLKADTSALTWLWDFGNGNTSTLKDPPKQIYPVANNYTIQLKVSNSDGCVSVDTKSVSAHPKPNLQIVADTAICVGKSVNLSVTGAATYVWTPALHLSSATSANPVAKPDSTVLYHVVGTTAFGCVDEDSVLIKVKYPPQLRAGKGDTLCAGRSVNLTANGAERYVWSPSAGLSNPYIANPVATPLESTNYRVVGSDNIGCYQDTAYVPVKVFPIPVVNAGEDKTINVGKSVELMPQVSGDVNNVNWSPTSGIFRNSYPAIEVKPAETQEYTVEVSNAGGCVARDKVTVNVLCNNANVFIPNTFSPNGDGSNDIFYPRGSGVFQIKYLKVFNRWGEVVFEKSNFSANDVSAGWDGTYKGQKLLPDVYVYLLNVVCDNNTILPFKGNVALIR